MIIIMQLKLDLQNLKVRLEFNNIKWYMLLLKEKWVMNYTHWH